VTQILGVVGQDDPPKEGVHETSLKKDTKKMGVALEGTHSRLNGDKGTLDAPKPLEPTSNPCPRVLIEKGNTGKKNRSQKGETNYTVRNV